jgi:tRNA pseudouridine38-40 synthase
MFETERPLEGWRWAFILNDHLPPSIRILSSQEAPLGFHAQKDAIGKEYVYRVLNRPLPSALSQRVYFIPKRLDWEKVRLGAAFFVGTHDFLAFQGAKAERKTTVRTITACHVVDEGDGFFSFRIQGSGFLKQMVRAMVGTLVEIGLHKRPVEAVSHILASRDRRQAGHTAPACGLTLLRVYYPGE